MEKATYGLVLSGGGVRGMAHIGVIQALHERNIEPEIIAGASSGALIGAFYAAGYAPEEMLSFFQKTALFTFDKYVHRKPGILNTEKFLKVFRPYFPDDRFEILKRKLLIVATDILDGHTKVFSTGPLIRAMLASAAFPFVLSPLEMDGKYYADGGITNNFPVELVRNHCEQVIGVYANPLIRIQPDGLTSSIAVLERALKIGMASDSIKKFKDCDILIAPDSLSRFTTFNTDHIREIFDIGYNHAVDQLDQLGL